MANLTKQVEGAAEEFGGMIKQGFGKLIGSDKMEANGQAMVREGKQLIKAAKAANGSSSKTPASTKGKGATAEKTVHAATAAVSRVKTKVTSKVAKKAHELERATARAGAGAKKAVSKAKSTVARAVASKRSPGRSRSH